MNGVGSSPLKLEGHVQHYRWGRSAAHSRIAKITGEINDSRPFAELWFGTHPHGPTFVVREGKKVPLQSVTGDLPFLFKVLSVGQPLSIQAHPDLALAKKLHARDPKNYPDANHKPEIAIALSPVEMLYGFRPNLDLEEICRRVPEFEIFGTERRSLPEFYRQLMTADVATVERASHQLYQRLGAKNQLSPEERWILKLKDQYPTGDVGLFCFFLFNFVSLAEGEGVFTEPNVPHAHLSGELIECMATSDNVVRGGLTEKFRDTKTLCEMLNYKGRPFTPLMLRVDPATGISRYEAPVKEFSVSLLNIKPSPEKYSPEGKSELLFILAGNGKIDGNFEPLNFTDGECFLIPAGLSSYQLTGSRSRIIRVTIP